MVATNADECMNNPDDIASTYCFVAAPSGIVGSALNISGPVNVPPLNNKFPVDVPVTLPVNDP